MGEILSLTTARPIRCLVLIVLLPWSAVALAAAIYPAGVVPSLASDRNIAFLLNRMKMISDRSAQLQIG